MTIKDDGIYMSEITELTKKINWLEAEWEEFSFRLLMLEIKAGYNQNQPRHPAGRSDGGRWSGGSGGVPDSVSNSSLKVFNRHYKDHGKDFNAKSQRDYADKAQRFYRRAQKLKMPMLIRFNDQRISVYDPKTNIFGVYDKFGKTVTFFKPKEGRKYFERELSRWVSSGKGKIVNPLPQIQPARGGSSNPYGPRAGLFRWRDIFDILE